MVMRDSVPCKIPVLGLVAVGVLALGVLPGLTLCQQEQKPAKIATPSQPAQQPPAKPAEPLLTPYVGEVEFFTLPILAQAAPGQGDERDRKIKELEDKLQAILKEVKALREARGAHQATT